MNSLFVGTVILTSMLTFTASAQGLELQAELNFITSQLETVDATMLNTMEDLSKF